MLRVSAAGNGKWDKVPVNQVKSLINDKGFTILDIRSPTEVAEVGSKLIWKHVALAALTDEGPVWNKFFLASVKEEFPNTMSRLLVVRTLATLPPPVVGEARLSALRTRSLLLGGCVLRAAQPCVGCHQLPQRSFTHTLSTSRHVALAHSRGEGRLESAFSPQTPRVPLFH